MFFLFNFCQFDYSELWCVPSWVYPARSSLHFLNLVDFFLSQVRGDFSYYVFKYFLRSFFSLLSFWHPCNVKAGAINIFLEVSKVVFISFYSFFFLYLVLRQWFPPFCLPDHLSMLSQLFHYWLLLMYFFFSVIVLLISVCLFFSSSRSL